MVKFAEKIASREAWRAAGGDMYTTVEAFDNRSKGAPWWACREAARVTCGTYETTEVIDQLNKGHQFCLHVSLLDRNLVAFTPDARAGEADKQLQISLGRFIVKFFPFYTDEYVQLMVADHLAELNLELELLTSAADIKEAYLTGPSSCMSKEFSFEGVSYHPSELYATPGVSLAVLRDENGRVNARTLIVEQDRTKGYIRPYGDEKLRKRLQKLGIRPTTFHGVKFKAIPTSEPDEDGSRTYLMPYLDGLGGPGDSTMSTVALIDGVLHSVDYEKAQKLRILGLNSSVAVATNTYGGVRLVNANSESFTAYDYFTGEALSKLSGDIVEFYHSGELRSVKNGALPDGLETARYYIGANYRTVAVQAEDTFRHEESYRSPRVVDTEHARLCLGYKRLCSAFYQEATDWVSERFTVSTDEGSILRVDAVIAVTEAGAWSYQHRSRVVRKSKGVPGWTQVAPGQVGMKTFAVDASSVKRTPSNRKVVVGYHRVTQCFDGSVDFYRNIVCSSFLGVMLHHAKGQTINFRPGSDAWLYAVEESARRGYMYKGLSLAARSEQLARAVYIGSDTLSPANMYGRPVEDWKRLFYGMAEIWKLESNQQGLALLHWTQLKEAEMGSLSYDDKGSVTTTKLFDYGLAEMEAQSYDNRGSLTTTRLPIISDWGLLETTENDENTNTDGQNHDQSGIYTSSADDQTASYSTIGCVTARYTRTYTFSQGG